MKGWFMMPPSLIEVDCRSEYKADELPRSVFVSGRWVDVEEVLDRWYQGDRSPGSAVTEYFKVLADNGREYLLRHDRELDLWFLEKRW